MDMLIKKLAAGNAVRTRLRQCPFTVGQRHIARPLLADDVVEPAVTAEAQRIEIARRVEFFLGHPGILQRQRALAAAETQLRKAVVNLFRLVEVGRRLPEVAARLGFGTGVEEALPLIQAGFRKISTVQRRERRAILQVHRHRAQHDFRAAVSARGDDVFQILLEIIIDRTEARVGTGQFIFDERPHALPFTAAAGGFLRRAPQRRRTIRRVRVALSASPARINGSGVV